MSPASPKEFYPEANDTPKRFDVETHQIEVFRGSKKGEELWEFLEKLEIENDPKRTQGKTPQGA